MSHDSLEGEYVSSFMDEGVSEDMRSAPFLYRVKNTAEASFDPVADKV